MEFCFYDFLVIASGATPSFFGLDNVKAVAQPMKSVVDAISIRNTILENMEKALITDLPEEKEPYLNIVVVGGGPTGTEIAGALAEMKKHIFPKEYKELDISRVRIIVIEGSSTLLKGMSVKSSQKSREYLLKLGVEVYTGSYVKDYVQNSVILSNGERIASKTVIWAAGIRGNKINGMSDT
ncbi:MAG: FAD-dependent oxidoreductase, partial [Bacteroidales bacterium]|nr:FAD-dependent oxidoreductase [Bacteroidales bacterium]